MKAIYLRRSVRQFTDSPVKKEQLDEILKGAMAAPSAHNTQPWEFLVLTKREVIDTVSEMSPYAKPLKTATACIIVLGNTKTAEKTLPWLPQDLSACTENILLQIADAGLGGLWMGFYPDEQRVAKLKEYFNLPPEILPFSVIAIGYPEKEPKQNDNFKPEKIHYEAYEKRS